MVLLAQECHVVEYVARLLASSCFPTSHPDVRNLKWTATMPVRLHTPQLAVLAPARAHALGAPTRTLS
jgi:hypothetical protein